MGAAFSKVDGKSVMKIKEMTPKKEDGEWAAIKAKDTLTEMRCPVCLRPYKDRHWRLLHLKTKHPEFMHRFAGQYQVLQVRPVG